MHEDDRPAHGRYRFYRVQRVWAAHTPVSRVNVVYTLYGTSIIARTRDVGSRLPEAIYTLHSQCAPDARAPDLEDLPVLAASARLARPRYSGFI